jgi:hypothetical protein
MREIDLKNSYKIMVGNPEEEGEKIIIKGI